VELTENVFRLLIKYGNKNGGGVIEIHITETAKIKIIKPWA
jgi:hypothetical protein